MDQVLYLKQLKSAQQYFKEIEAQIQQQSDTSQTNRGPAKQIAELEAAEAERRRLRDAALGLRDQGIAVERARIDTENKIADVRLQFQDQIRQKEEETARLRIDAERNIAQLRIEQTDLDLQQQAFDAGDLTGDLINAAREFIRTRG